MSLRSRHRTSFVMLLVLALGLAAAGAAAAAGAREMACCPAGMGSDAQGCTWLGAGDCCPERPGAPAPSSTAVPAPAVFVTLILPAPAAAPAALPAGGSCTKRTPRSEILRL